MRNCTLCDEEPLIDGCCYDCAVSCIVCQQEPAHPGIEMCDKCLAREIDESSDAVTGCGDK